jgi:glycosyltransferase involved in cell wall biosynthesis
LKSLISIGIPVFNGERFISIVLDSLLNQSYKNIEIIISDNFSDDSTESICRRYVDSDSRIKYHRQNENIGMFPNFNFVFNKSVGEYFMWAAADDKWDSNFLDQAKDILDFNPECVSVLSHFEIFDIKSGNIIEKITPSSISSELPSVRIKRVLEELHPNLIYGLHRKSMLIENKFESIDWSDILFVSRLVAKGKYYIIPRVYYRIGINGTHRIPYSVTGKWLNLNPFFFKYLHLISLYSPSIFSFVKMFFFTLKSTNSSSIKVNIEIFKYSRIYKKK